MSKVYQRLLPIVIVIAILGLIELARFKPTATHQTALAGTTATASPSSSGTSSNANSSSTSSSSTTSSTTASYKDGTYTGDTVDIGFGPVQVAATVSGGKITNVKTLQLPNQDGHSAMIASYAAPQLIQEALKAQSANIDIISGATLTSNGFAQSLDSALKQAS